MNQIFSNNRNYKLWHYYSSHNCLIIRSEKQYPDVKYQNKYDSNCTIDIEFTGVEYVDIPASLEKIAINIVEDIPKKFLKFINKNEKVFQISTNSINNYYIIASNLIIGESDWGFDKDKLSDINLEYSNIVFPRK